MTEQWYLWQDSCHSAAMNMAIDEALMEKARMLPGPLLRLYEWRDDAISFGYTQKFDRVPLDVEDRVRRPTGGGIVYHKYHFTYTVVLAPDHWIVKDTLPIESYNWLNRCVQDALSHLSLESRLARQEIPKSVDRAGMICFTTPTRYDLLANDKKIAGSAQRRTKQGMLHQGSIECDGIEFLSPESLRRVLPMGFGKVIPAVFTEYSPFELIENRAQELCEEKYATPRWNERR